MATKKKMLQAAAGNAGGGAGLDVEEVFSTYLYTGAASNQTITNGIDLSGEGGLVWIKGRTNPQSHGFFDTERGVNKALASDANWAEFSYQGVNAFNSNGFQVGYQNEYNQFTLDYASWTFRKAPKFFDVVTYTGDGVAGRTVSHNLGSAPGCMMIKSTNDTQNWYVYHTGIGNGFDLFLNTTNAKNGANTWNYTDPTSTEFTLSSARANVSGNTYVAYLFAHNDGDAEFGPNGNADIIKCGSYTGNGSGTAGPEIDLGFEPQWILAKRTDSIGYWTLVDSMRGMIAGGDDKILYPNTSDAEQQSERFVPSATGFQVNSTNGYVNASGGTYIYMAIRRGPLAQPESGTEVFDIQSLNNAGPYSVGFPTDLLLLNITGGSSSNTYVGSRLTGGDKYLRTSSTAAEGTSSGIWSFDLQDSFTQNASPSSPWLGYHWKRAPGYFDVVAYKGVGANTVVNHNLNAIPEMAFVKNRGRVLNWNVYHKDLVLGSSDDTECRLFLNTTSAVSAGATFWGAHTDTTFVTGVQNFQTNYPNDTYIAYLFASLPGISKVGSASHSGTTNVDCGFTSGARYVLLKRTDASGDWYVWDSVRGIVSGNDPYLLLNSTAAQVTTTDYIDPLASGFTITSNFTAGDYIFYAIA